MFEALFAAVVGIRNFGVIVFGAEAAERVDFVGSGSVFVDLFKIGAVCVVHRHDEVELFEVVCGGATCTTRHW